MKKYVKSFPARVGYTDDQKSKYDKRLLEYATEGLKDLTLIAEQLPEELQGKIFDEQYLKKFFRAIFNMDNFLQKTESEGMIKIPNTFSETRERMLKVCNLALTEIGQQRNALLLAPRAWQIIRELPSSTHDVMYGTNAIQAIQIEGYLSLKKLDDFLEHAKGR